MTEQLTLFNRTLTARRKKNFLNAYGWIEWNWDSLIIPRRGHGDCPVFHIEGTYKGLIVKYKCHSQSGTPGYILFQKKVTYKVGVNYYTKYFKVYRHREALWKGDMVRTGVDNILEVKQ